MPPRFKWDAVTGTFELAEEQQPQSQLPSQMAADYGEAEQMTKAFLDGVHTKERRYLEAYDLMRKIIENARTPEERRKIESNFDNAHVDTVKHRDEEIRNRDTAIQNVWSSFSERWPRTTCKLTTAAETSSGKTYRTVEIDSPYLGKRVIGPTKVPEACHLVDESKGGFRALARQPQRFLPQSYIGQAPVGSAHPLSARAFGSGFGSSYGSGGHHHNRDDQLTWGPSVAHNHYKNDAFGWQPSCVHRQHYHGSSGGGSYLQYHQHHSSGWGPM
jgi:hypothetical protein